MTFREVLVEFIPFLPAGLPSVGNLGLLENCIHYICVFEQRNKENFKIKYFHIILYFFSVNQFN